MEVVEEPLDVEEEESSDVATLDTGLDRMDHAQDGIRRCMIVTGPKLTGGEELEACSIQEDVLQDNSFQEFTTALKEGDGAVCFCNPVIYFTGFWNRDHSRQTPRVMPEAYSSVENGGETGGSSSVAPLQEFVSYSCGAGGRFVGGAQEISGDLLVGDGREISRGEWGGVRGVRVGDWFWDDGEEPV